MANATDMPARGEETCILVNEDAGRRAPGEAARVLRALAETAPRPVEVRVLERTQSIESEARRAAAQGFGTVAAAGGDGTISSVAAGLRQSGSTLGIVPFGTFNFVARGLGIPQDTEAAFQVLTGGVTRPMPIGDVNGRAFLNNASLGVYPAILATREGIYRRWGRSRLAAHWSTLRTVCSFHKPLALRVTVDGVPRERETSLVFVARSAYQLEEFGLEGAEAVRAGGFAMFLAPDCSRAQMLLRAGRLAWAGMRRGEDFELLCGKEILIETGRNTRLFALDGERERLSGPFRFRVLRDALRVIVPPDAAERSPANGGGAAAEAGERG